MHTESASADLVWANLTYLPKVGASNRKYNKKLTQ